MLLGRAHLIQCERRVRKGLCIYYGLLAISSPSAPNCKKDGLISYQGALISQTIISPTPHFCQQLQGSLSWQQHSTSPSPHNFINLGLILQADLPAKELLTPKDNLTVNGKIHARITHCTLPLTLLLSDNHHSSFQFFLLSFHPTLGWSWVSLG